MKKTIMLSVALLPCFAFAQQKEKNTAQEQKIEGVTMTKTKKAVEQKPDRTVFDFSEQPSLNSGTLMEGIKKLPGLIVTDIAGMMYQGKLLAVYMDGRPLNISSNELQSFLDGMPANSVERIEVITQPGAEFPATSGGAILNIITSKTARNYLTATYSGNYGFSYDDKYRHRTNHSLNLNARNKLFGWQMTFGQNYREGMQQSDVDDLSTAFTDSQRRGYYGKAALTFDLGMDRLLLNYDLNTGDNDSETSSTANYLGNILYSDDHSENVTWRHAVGAAYQKRFADKGKTLDIKYDYARSTTDFNQFNFNTNANTLDNGSSSDYSAIKVDYNQPLKILDEGKISAGGLYEYLGLTTHDHDLENLDYNRHTAATYLQLQAKWKKWNFIAGTRAENYDIGGKTRNLVSGNILERDLQSFNKFKFFPNASVQYTVMPQVIFSLNYNKKINLPSISALNPNNNTYQNATSVTTGNPDLQPTIFDNYEVKLSAFDYAFIGYNTSIVKDQVVQVITRENILDAGGNVLGNYISSSQLNVHRMRTENFSLGVPIPFMIFTKPLKEIMSFNFNPDKINFLYVYAAYQKHIIDGVDSKGNFIFNFNAQIMLPGELKINANYFVIPTHGNYYYFVPTEPVGNNLDITLSKKFMADRLNISLFANDVLNGNRNGFQSVYKQPYVNLYSKTNTRSFGVSINYKIPTKNKLAKEDPNLLKNERTEENTGTITPPTP